MSGKSASVSDYIREKLDYLRDWLNEENLGGAVGVALLLLMIAHGFLDEFFFAAHRPWNLFLFGVEIGVIGVGLYCLVPVLLKMCASEQSRLLGIVSALLTVCCWVG